MGRAVDGLDIVSIHAFSGHAVKRAGPVEVIEGAPLAPVHMARVEIVLADEEHRQAIQPCEVQRFVYASLFERAVSEKGGRDGARSGHFGGECRAHRERNGARHDRHGSEDAPILRD